MKKYVSLLVLFLSCCMVNAQLPSSSAASKDGEQINTTVLEVYYSVTGNTEKRAQAIAAGAKKISMVNVRPISPDS